MTNLGQAHKDKVLVMGMCLGTWTTITTLSNKPKPKLTVVGRLQADNQPNSLATSTLTSTSQCVSDLQAQPYTGTLYFDIRHR